MTTDYCSICARPADAPTATECDPICANCLARQTLRAILDAHSTLTSAAECLTDYIDDPAAISSPALIDDLDALLESLAIDADDTDATEIAETIAPIHPAFAREFAMINELCPDHFCDFENCFN